MFPPFGFSIQEFLICYFYCQKTAFVCEFQHTPLWKLMIFSRFHISCKHEFCGHVPNSPRKKTHSKSTLKSGFLEPQKIVVPLW
jgi:hypothetical protein